MFSHVLNCNYIILTSLPSWPAQYLLSLSAPLSLSSLSLSHIPPVLACSVPPTSTGTTESLNSLELSPGKKTTSDGRASVTKKEPPRRRRINVPKKVVGQIETILRAFPAGIWISRFPIEFKVSSVCLKRKIDSVADVAYLTCSLM